MPNNSGFSFVLWGERFDEVAATVFVTEFRKAGLKVKVVGLTPRRISGAYGLALVPDMTLEQALRVAEKAVYVIVPRSSSGIKLLTYDPRLSKFFERSQGNNARFVVNKSDEADVMALLPAGGDNIVAYDEGEDLLAFARERVRELAGLR